MSAPIILLLVGLVGGLFFVPIMRRFALHVGLVDKPDVCRKVQSAAIPLAGGPAVLAAFIVALLVGAAIDPSIQTTLLDEPHKLAALLVGAVLMAIVGGIDDWRGSRGRAKLLGQVAAIAVVVFGGGLMVERVFLLGTEIHLGVMAIPFTFFWFLGAVNVLNLIDGMDGLLGSIGFLVCATMAVLAALTGQVFVACAAAALAGALLGFLVFNFPPASVYMGDSGSLTVGLLVAALAIMGSLKGTATVALAAPMTLLVLPIFDTAAAIIRRKLTGRSVYTTDRGHLHHCLQRSGLSRQRVLLLVGGLSLLTAGGVLASMFWQNDWYAVGSAVTVVLILSTARLFGHAEFVLLKQRVLAILGRCASGSDGQLLEVRLQGQAAWTDVWQPILAGGKYVGADTVSLDVNAPWLHEGYHARWDRDGGDAAEQGDGWRAEVPLLAAGRVVGRVTLAGRHGERSVWDRLADFGRAVARAEDAVLEVLAAHSASAPRPAALSQPGSASQPSTELSSVV